MSVSASFAHISIIRLIGRMPFAPTQTKMRLIGRMPFAPTEEIKPAQAGFLCVAAVLTARSN
ncbi:MAG: hypothetical protein RLZZ338_4837 [Cyanobacteriota bacterium]|jgi:hypothetical protein